MNNSDACQFTISLADISTALGVSRTTVWRIFQGRELLHSRVDGRKHFLVADTICPLRVMLNHNPKTETTLLFTDNYGVRSASSRHKRMTFESTQKLVEQYKVLDSLTESEKAPLHECEVSLEVALRQKFGNRLSEIMVQDVVGSIARDPDIFHYVVTGVSTLVNPARRNLAFSDATLQTKLETEYMQNLKPEVRIKYDRDGSLVNRMAAHVTSELNKQA